VKSEGEHMKKLLKTKKAVSKVIGLLAIIIVFVVLGSIYYSYTIAYVGSMKDTFQTQMEKLLLEAVDINSSHIIASVKNNGIMEAKITDASVDGVANILLQGIMIAGKSMGTTYLIGMYSKGVSYAVELMFNLGTSITFSVMY
jgi:FlaG/FlaF family flagellin (archaellin)